MKTKCNVKNNKRNHTRLLAQKVLIEGLVISVKKAHKGRG